MGARVTPDIGICHIVRGLRSLQVKKLTLDVETDLDKVNIVIDRTEKIK